MVIPWEKWTWDLELIDHQLLVVIHVLKAILILLFRPGYHAS
jgi:hypothetical protein